jgi:hypothetical protein
MFLPSICDLKPSGKLLFERPEYGQPGYFDNVQYTLQLHFDEDGVHVIYYGEDDTFLPEEKVKEVIKHSLKTASV